MGRILLLIVGVLALASEAQAALGTCAGLPDFIQENIDPTNPDAQCVDVQCSISSRNVSVPIPGGFAVETEFVLFIQTPPTLLYDCVSAVPLSLPTLPTVTQALPSDVTPPSQTQTVVQNPSCTSGSIITIDNQSLGEVVPVVGAPFSLYYYSNRVPGQLNDFKLHIPLTGASIVGVSQVLLNIQYSGRTFQQTYAAQANLSYDFVWDGLDSSGNKVEGSTTATVTVTYVRPDNSTSSQTYTNHIGHWSTAVLGLGGWVPSIVHYYDVGAQRVYFGSGEIKSLPATAVLQTDGSNHYTSASDDGSEVYTFGSTGQLLQTNNGLTGDLIYSFAYDSTGRLVSITDAFQNVTSFTYGSGSVAKNIMSPYGQGTTLTADSNSWLSSIANPAGNTFSMTNTASGLLQTFTKPNGHQSTLTYDSNGLLLKDLGAGGNFTQLLATVNGGQSQIMSSTALGRVTQYNISSDMVGNATTTTVDPEGLMSTFANYPYGTSTSQNSTGVATSSTTTQDARLGWAAPFVSSASTSINGTSLQLTTSSSQTAQLSDQTNIFSIATLSTSTELQNDPTRIFNNIYEGPLRISVSTSPVGRTSTTTLNSKSRLASIQAGVLTPVQFVYDSHGRVSTINQASRQTAVSYDQFGNESSIKDAMGRVTKFSYDGAGRVTSVQRPDGKTIQYGYDASGNLTSLTPPGRAQNLFAIDLFDFVGSYAPPLLSGVASVTTQYSYNLDRQLTQITRPDGKVISLNYDQIGGQLLSMSAPDANISITYSASTGQIASVTSQDTVSTNYTYTGPLVSSVANSGPVSGNIHYTYNTDFTLASLSITGSAAISYGYDKDGLVTSVGAENLIRDSQVGLLQSTTIGKVSETLTHNTFGETTDDLYKVQSSTVFEEQIIRDNLGRIIEKTEKGTWIPLHYQYSYDSVGRLSRVSIDGFPISDYVYDDNGNRVGGWDLLSPDYAIYDAQDRLIQYKQYVYTYNANGDLMSKYIPGFGRNPQPQNQTQYTYDSFGNLKTVILPDHTRIDYLVDGLNRRVGKKLNGKLVKSWIYQNRLQIAAETDGSGNVTSRYVYASKGNIPDYMITSQSTFRIVSDHLGSPRVIVDAASGRVTARMNFDEFGRSWGICDNNPLPFGFAGGLTDSDTGLVRFGVRDYDPVTGRWLTKDPSLFGGRQTNLYDYSMNDPVNKIDVNGLAPGDVFSTFSAALQDALQYVYNLTSMTGNEYAGQILQNGNTFTYTTPNEGTQLSSDPGDSCPNAVAVFHSHPSFLANQPVGTLLTPELFSPGDIAYAQGNNIPVYLVTPSGYGKGVTPGTNGPIFTNPTPVFQ